VNAALFKFMRVKIKKSILVEIPMLNATQNTFPIPNQPFLIGKKITAISGSSMLTSPTTGKTNWLPTLQIANGAALNAVYLTLYDKSDFRFVENLPIAEILNTTFWTIDSTTPTTPPADNKVYLNANNGMFEFVPREITWSKCTAFFPTAPGSTSYCILINVFYEDVITWKLKPSDLWTKCVNFQFVSIPVLQYQNKYYFPDLPQLRNAKIQRIHCYFNGVINKDVSNVTTITYLNAIGMCLTLYGNGEELIKQLDLPQIQPFQVKSLPILNDGDMYFDNLEIDFSKSYVEAPVNFFTVVTSLNFGIFYTL
jgi:hypothetical protein